MAKPVTYEFGPVVCDRRQFIPALIVLVQLLILGSGCVSPERSGSQADARTILYPAARDLLGVTSRDVVVRAEGVIDDRPLTTNLIRKVADQAKDAVVSVYVNSLMGRYFPYRMHPFSIAESLCQDLPDSERVVRLPRRMCDEDFTALWTHGGYPEPFIKRDIRFSRRWRKLRMQQLLREDVRDLTQIHQLDQLEVLVNLLASRSAHQLIYSKLASTVQVSVDTMRRWISTLCNLHVGFLLRPWYKNVSRSLRKEPKWFLRDWSTIDDPGDRAETFIACHLLKAVDGWTDLGLGDFQLGYLRDKNQREVDFVVVRDGRPWFLVEAKYAEDKLSPSLKYYQQQMQAPFAFQVVIEADYVKADCFVAKQQVKVVPARTFLAQLL